MTFKLKHNEPLQQGIRRVVRQQIEAALDECAADKPIEEVVHELRRTFKRIRSLLRLGRYALGKAAYRRENVAFRDAGRRLSNLRDAKVLNTTLDKVVAAEVTCIGTELVEQIQRLLADDERRSQARLAKVDGLLVATQEILTQALVRSDEWTAIRVRKREIIRAVKSTYQRGRHALGAATESGVDERFHECRKHVKYLRHELEALTPVSPAYLKPMAKQASKLGDLLGADHDFALLKSYVRQAKLPKRNAAGRETLIAAIEELRGPIRAEAIALGEAFYALGSGHFAESLRKLWKRRRKQGAGACRDQQPG